MITVITTHGRFTVADAEHWARDDSGDVHLYATPSPSHPSGDAGGDTLATVEGARFIAAYKSESAVDRPEDGFDRNPNTPER